MKKPVVFGYAIILFTLCLNAQDAVFDLDESKAFNLGQLLEKNNVIFIHPADVDTEGESLFILDLRLCHVLEIDTKTGSLVKIISARGQGPAELGFPTCIRVKGGLLYICDRAYGGIKIFDTHNGQLVRATKINANMDDIDILNNGHVILNKPDLHNNSLIGEYDDNGNLIRNIVYGALRGLKESGKEYYKETYVRFCLDAEENLVVLYPLKRVVAKYDSNGKLLWEKSVDNKVLRKNITAEDSIRTSSSGAISYVFNVFNLAADLDGNILVGHNGGGQMFSESGDTIALLQGKNLDTFVFLGKKIISILPDGYAYIFDLNSLRR